jgi:hypothetical protein
MQGHKDRKAKTDSSPNMALFHLVFPASQQLTALDVHL